MTNFFLSWQDTKTLCQENEFLIYFQKKLACPNHALRHLIGYFDPQNVPQGLFLTHQKFRILFLNRKDTKPNVKKKYFVKIFLTHPSKPATAIFILWQKAQRPLPNFFRGSQLDQKTNFKRYPFLKLRRVFHPTSWLLTH